MVQRPRFWMRHPTAGSWYVAYLNTLLRTRQVEVGQEDRVKGKEDTHASVGIRPTLFSSTATFSLSWLAHIKKGEFQPPFIPYFSKLENEYKTT